MRGKENRYASEFHKLLVTKHKKFVMGCKTHGGPFQKAGFPDYLWWWNRNVKMKDPHDFMGCEFKYIHGKKVPKRVFRPERWLRKDQKRFLVSLNEFGYKAIQATFIEFSPRCRVLVFNRVWDNGKTIEIPADRIHFYATYMSDKNNKDEWDLTFEDGAKFNYFIVYRSPNKPHYPWHRIIDGLRKLV
jgi:hypothetical protein